MSLSRSLLLVIWSLLGLLTFASVSSAQDNPHKIFTTRDGLAGDYVTAIAFARDGSAWVGTTEGATHITPQRWTSYTRVHGLGDSWITDIAVAPDERVWFGTQSGGVSVFDPGSKTITTYNLDSSDIPSNFITAIAVDENNRVWIDTLDKGIAQLDAAQNKWTRTDSPMPRAPTTPNTWRATPRGLVVTNPPAWLKPTAPYPTVLVHGWTVAGDDTLETSEFRFLKSYADRDGIPMYYVRGVSPKNTLYQNAQVIRDEIARVKKETGADKVNVIAFSMGGMNTRVYLETSLYANDVNRAIILGTPQAGVDIWKPILFQQILQKPDEPSTIELSPEYAQMVVSQTRAPNPNVTYDLLIGDARQQTGLEFLDDMPASDALISVDSALSLNAPNVHQHVNADLHDWNPQAVPLELTGYLYPRDTWERYLRNALRNNDNAPIGSEILPSPVEREVGGEGGSGNHTPVITEKIRAGETVTRTVLLDENKSARFIAYYPGGKLDFSLVAPDGKKYEPNDLPRDEDGVLSLSTDIANFSGYVVKNAQPGKWQLILKRTDNGGEPLDVSTYAELDASRRITTGIEPKASGAMSRFVTVPIPNVEITARVGVPLSRNGEPYTLVPVQVNRAEENTRFYLDLPFDTPGWYPVFVTARGDAFERETEFLYDVPSDNIRFQEGLPLTIEQDTTMPNQNVPSSIGVQVKRAGDYALAAQIRNENDEIVARSFTPTTLDAGAQRIPFSLLVPDPNAWYTLDLTLYDANWAAVPADALQAHVKFQQPK